MEDDNEMFLREPSLASHPVALSFVQQDTTPAAPADAAPLSRPLKFTTLSPQLSTSSQQPTNADPPSLADLNLGTENPPLPSVQEEDLTTPFAAARSATPPGGGGPATASGRRSSSPSEGSTTLEPPLPGSAAEQGLTSWGEASDILAWGDVDCSDSAKAVLQYAGVSPATAKEMQRRLGYAHPEDLCLVDLAMVNSLNLPALEAVKLKRLLSSARKHLMGTSFLPPQPVLVEAALAAASAAAANSADGASSVSRLTSGRLQEVANCIGACTGAPCAIDLGGLTFSGPLTRGPSLFFDRANVILVNGTLHLRGDQRVVVTGSDVTFVGVTIRGDGRGGGSRSGTPPSTPSRGAAPAAVAAAAAAAAEAATSGMVQVQGGGQLALRGCHIGSCSGAGAALALKEGAAVDMDRCDVDCNASGSGVLVTGMSVRLSAWQSTLHDCLGSCMVVQDGAQVRMSGCTIERAGLRAMGLGRRSSPALRLSEFDLEDAGSGAGIEVCGHSRAFLRNCVVRDSAQGVAVHGGGSTAELHGCKLVGSTAKSGLQVSSNGKVTLNSCELGQNQEDGVALSDRGVATLTACTFAGNLRSAVSAAGQGSVATLIRCVVEGDASATDGGKCTTA